MDLVVTGASRGLGKALVEALGVASGRRLVLSARDRDRLAEVARAARARGAEVVEVPGDLGTVAGARALGAALAEVVGPGSTLVHNAGLWPDACRVGPDGLEQSFVVNAVALAPIHDPLLSRLARILGVGAGIMVRGRFDPAKTPTGADFGPIATYCNTKLAGAFVLRDLAARHPELDVLVIHPGVVDTDLGVRSGVLGPLIRAVKRLAFERPEDAGQRLARVLAREDRWSPPGAAAWWDLETPAPWPAVAEDPVAREAVLAAVARALGGSPAA